MSRQDITGHFAQVREAMANAAQRVGRDPADVKLIAVSKTQPPEAIEAAMATGQRLFGENMVQEALTKISHCASKSLEWHFIGHLQSNKVRHIPGHFDWLHSLDTVKLAQRLSRLASENRVVVKTLIEVNVTRDPAKHGVDPDQLPALLEAMLKESLPGIALCGLMCMGPQDGNETELRSSFASLRTLRDSCQRQFSLPGFTELSMGMSNDFVEAILEGATFIRVGSALFGARLPRR